MFQAGELSRITFAALPIRSAGRFSPRGLLGIALPLGSQPFHNEIDIGKLPVQPEFLRTIIASGIRSAAFWTLVI